MLRDIKLGLGISRSGEAVIVIGLTSAENFAVWNQLGCLTIYDADLGDVIDPMQADTVWEAIDLFVAWNSCVSVLK